MPVAGFTRPTYSLHHISINACCTLMPSDIPLRTITKVTAFVTRPGKSPGDHELLVFRHPDAGIQLPAGSVEPGEEPGAAALREVEEETGLSETRLVALLGTRITELGSTKVFSEEARLRKGPSDDTESLVTLPRGWWCHVQGEQGDYSEVRYEELNRQTDPQMVIVRYSGWVRTTSLADRLERGYFHVRFAGSTPERWIQRAEDRFDFVCYWLPLFPKPEIRSLQQAWIDEYHDVLATSLQTNIGQ